MTKRFKEDPNGDWEVKDRYTDDWCSIRRVEEPMPAILDGDYIEHRHGAPSYIRADQIRLAFVEENIMRIFRHGNLIWERKR